MEALEQDKYVHIDPRYMLRGWLDQPYAIVDNLHAVAHFIPEGVFNTLQLCNGRFRTTDSVFYGPRQRQLALLAREGALTFSDEPSRLEPEQEYRCYPNHYMRQVQWSMTGRCNYRCRHCFMNAPHGLFPQASTEECLRIADQIVESGVLVVKLTGGECLIRPDFLEIIDRLLAGGVQIATILSNGALVNEELLDALKERGVICGFDISFDGTDGWHDWLRGVPGAEEAAIRAFKLCAEKGFPTGAQVCIHKGNAGSVRKSLRLLGELGVGSVIASKVKAEGEALDINDKLLGQEEFFQICCELAAQFLEDGAPLDSLALGPFFKIVGGELRVGSGRTDYGDAFEDRPACAAVRATTYIGPDGYILPCIPMSYDPALKERFPNIETMTLSEALTDSDYYDFICTDVRDIMERNPKCRDCRYKTRCMGGCRVKGVDEDGNADPYGHDPESCRFYLGGYYDRAVAFIESLKAKA